MPKTKTPTAKQIRALARLDLATPRTRAEAQDLINNFERGGSKRKPKGPSGHYYLTPKAWRRKCGRGGCDEPAVAYRAFDRSYVCEPCIERLGIKARESRAWREGGAKAGSTVTIRHVDPESLRPTSPPEA
jgi:hypothetical protein